MTELEMARNIINAVDIEMAKLFAQRMDAVKTVAEYKKQHGLPIEDPTREAEMIARNSARIDNDQYRQYDVDFLKSAAVKINCELPVFEEQGDDIVVKLFSSKGWFADIHLDSKPIIYGKSEKYDNRGIETILYRYKSIHSIIDEIASEAAYQQAYRYSLMEDDE